MPNKSDVQKDISSTISIMSCICSSFVIFTYIRFPKLRKLANTLVLYVAIADFIRSFVKSWGEFEDGSLGCTLQGLFNNFGGCASFIWCTILSLLTYLLICHPMSKIVQSAGFKDGKLARVHKGLNLFVWPFVSGLCLFPFFTHSYGVAGGWCWIKHEEGKTLEHVWRWMCFYAWVFVAECVALGVYFRCYLKLRMVIDHVEASTGRTPRLGPAGTDASTRDSSHHSGNMSPSSVGVVSALDTHTVTGSAGVESQATKKRKGVAHSFHRLIRRIWMYPLILVFCWTPGIIRRCWQIAHPDHTPYWMSVSHAVCGNMYGIINCLVYCLISEKRVVKFYKVWFLGTYEKVRVKVTSGTGGATQTNTNASLKLAQVKQFSSEDLNVPNGVTTPQVKSEEEHAAGADPGDLDLGSTSGEARQTMTVKSAAFMTEMTVSAPRPDEDEDEDDDDNDDGNGDNDPDIEIDENANETRL